ncbi:MAG: hypothetical protein LC804_09200, partial [Acidobacteria bacterium]|nr:hypothetical protein [Acidobacteriota bacterium]
MTTSAADFVTVTGNWTKGTKAYTEARQKREIRGMLDESGRELPPHRELSSRIFLKTDGTWLMTAFHNTTVATAPAAPSIQETWRLVETALR